MNRDKAAFFDAQVRADWAAARYGETERPKLERLLAQAELAPGQRVLEPGCGTGRLTEVLAPLVGPDGHLAALDVSRAMTAACWERVAGCPWVHIEQAVLEEYPAQPAGFDRIICHQVFPHFDDQRLALDLMAGLLKPGGLLLIAHFMPSAVINDTHRKAGSAVERDQLPNPGSMSAMLAGAGLERISLVDDELGYLLKARRPKPEEA